MPVCRGGGRCCTHQWASMTPKKASWASLSCRNSGRPTSLASFTCRVKTSTWEGARTSVGWHSLSQHRTEQAHLHVWRAEVAVEIQPTLPHCHAVLLAHVFPDDALSALRRERATCAVRGFSPRQTCHAKPATRPAAHTVASKSFAWWGCTPAVYARDTPPSWPSFSSASFAALRMLASSVAVMSTLRTPTAAARSRMAGKRFPNCLWQALNPMSTRVAGAGAAVAGSHAAMPAAWPSAACYKRVH